MQTKLTLRLEQTLIEQAKHYAEQHGYSLSQLVANYFALLNADASSDEQAYASLPPITRSLAGILAPAKPGTEAEPADEPADYQADYRRYLEQKYV